MRLRSRAPRLCRPAAALAVAITAATALTACGTPVVEFPSAPAPTFAGEELFTTGTPPPTTATTEPPASTTSTTAPVVLREVAVVELAPGDCVVWQQGRSTGPITPTKVDCATPHLAEVTARVDLATQATANTPYPAADEWGAFVESVCRTEAQKRLGRHDPAGRFAVTALHPGPAGWKAGERLMYCVVQARRTRLDPTSFDTAVPFTGKAADIDQTLLFEAGTCLAADENGRLAAVVACSAPHQYEVAGTVDVSAATTLPADRDAWRALVSDDCRRVAVAYLGRELRTTESVLWSIVGELSWEAGRRDLECVVAEVTSDGAPVVRTQPLRR